VTSPPRFEHRVEPLSASHRRDAFRSGVPELDNYLHHQAGQDAKRKAAAPFVQAGRDGSILGYHTLSAYGVRAAKLPEEVAKRLPRYPLLPATLLGRLAVDAPCRGLGLGRFLLMDALYRSLQNTSEVASVGVVVDALDERAQALYLHHEFQPLGDHPAKLFLTMVTIEKGSKASGTHNLWT
jgi:GNAT superfamily N-acetyltransferase